MKPVKNLVFAALLVFSIALNTFAGDIDLPGSPAPAPPPPRATAVTPDTNNTDDQQAVETADYPWYEVLTALLSVY
jgi:hypothetical protein